MLQTKRTATWLDLVVRGARQECGARIHSHAVQGRSCLVVALDERLVHDGKGRVTVFQDQDALDRFLALSGWDEAQHSRGPAVSVGIDCNDRCCCLRLERGKRLTNCRARS